MILCPACNLVSFLILHASRQWMKCGKNGGLSHIRQDSFILRANSRTFLETSSPRRSSINWPVWSLMYIKTRSKFLIKRLEGIPNHNNGFVSLLITNLPRLSSSHQDDSRRKWKETLDWCIFIRGGDITKYRAWQHCAILCQVSVCFRFSSYSRLFLPHLNRNHVWRDEIILEKLG